MFLSLYLSESLETMTNLPKTPLDMAADVSNSQEVRHVRRQSILIIALGLVLLCLASGLGYFALHQHEKTQAEWSEHNQQVIELNQTLAEFDRTIGYAGFIDHFKNLVLRRDIETYGPLIEKDLAHSLQLIDKLDSLSIADDVVKLRAMVNGFQEKYRLARTLIQEGKSSAVIDAALPVADADALAAINNISQGLHAYSKAIESAAEQKNLAAEKLLYISGAVLIASVILAILTLLIYLKRITSSHLTSIQQQLKIQQQRLALEQTFNELRTTEERYTFALDGSGDGVWDWDIAANKVFLSRRWKTMLGHDEDEIGADLSEWSGRLHPTDADRVMAVVNDNLEGKTQSFSSEHRMLCKDGSYIWVLDRGTVVQRDADGKPLRMVGTHSDITAAKQQEAKLQSTRDQLEKAAEVAELGIWCWDLQTNALEFNERMHEIYESPPEVRKSGLYYEYWRARVHPEDIAFTEDRLQQALKGKGTYNPTFRIINRQGKIRYIQAAGFVECSEAGKPIQMMGINRDITQQYESEDALRRAKKTADEASKAKSNFLANMSHELRTPMNAILGMLTLLQKTELNHRQADYAQKTEGAARSLLGLLNDILDLSKAEAGKMQLDPHPFAIDQVLRDLSVILSTNVGKKPVEVLYDIAADVPSHLVGDAMRLQQVLLNLGSNAIKFTEQGSVIIKIETQQKSTDSATLVFTVSDTGIGIAPENQARIFSGFTQAEASTTRRFGGTGLGVSISQRLVNLMGGQLALTSALGKGSSFFFTITLPLPVNHQATPPKSENVGQHVLVVDDNPSALNIIAHLGESLGWKIDRAASGEQALSLLKQQAQGGNRYRAVFVDWQMPGLNGLETSKAIHDLDVGISAPVVVMVTAHERENLAQRSEIEQAIINGFVVKPITASMLMDALDGLTDTRIRPSAETADTKNEPRLAGMAILLTEDNLTNQQVARELLEAEGARVTIANNGQEAVERLAKEPAFDVVLMDLQMPVLDGLTATKRIRKELLLTKLPIVAMTANAMQSDREACIQAGMNDHVGKPFDVNNLVNVLLQHAGRQSISSQHLGTQQAVPQPKQPEKSEYTDLASAAQIDLASALARLGGKQELYVRMFPMFLANLKELPQKLMACLEAQDYLQASQKLHSLKGTAGTMGATELAAQAALAEKQLAGEITASAARLQVLNINAMIGEMLPNLELLLRAFQPPVVAS